VQKWKSELLMLLANYRALDNEWLLIGVNMDGLEKLPM
jgi:hypothetical protein